MANETAMQPLLNAAAVVYRAPVQVWSASDGELGGQPIHGVYYSDVRLLSHQHILIDGLPLEHLATIADGATRATFVSVARQLDDPTPDPGVRVEHRRTATLGGVVETLVIQSRRSEDAPATVRVEIRLDASPMDLVKAGLTADAPTGKVAGDTITWSHGGVDARLEAPGAVVDSDALEWSVVVPAGGSIEVSWSLSAVDELAVVAGVETSPEWSGVSVASGDDRLARWSVQALADLDALRLTARDLPGEFLAAGAPWFFTLFGRDSIWAARFLLPLGTSIAADTLRVLAGLQGRHDVADTAEEPGKIMHELRRVATDIPSEGIHLPPLYFGTIDATPLWICLLHDAWRWGMPDDEVRELLPHLTAALEWMRDFGDADGDGLLEYVDKSGRGLANQGWKDSGDSVQWRDGTLATGPIALCEVQAYAYEAATHGADVLDAFGLPGGEWRDWAARLREKFTETFWIEDAAGAYVAIALDADKRPVDTVTSNLGHLLGTGILTERQAGLIAARLVSPELNSGFGLRTMSTESAGYWPLSYHGGSVWTHDTAIAIAGLTREGFRHEADVLTEGLLAAASGFDYRMPELHSGDARTDFARPVPYPAACRPQAWSAAAAIAVLGSILGLQPGDGELAIDPSPLVGALRVEGLKFGGATGSVTTNAAGEVTAASGLPFVVTGP